MINIEQYLLKLPTGILSLVAVLLASFGPPLILVVIAVCLVFADITLGYIKQQAMNSLLNKHKQLAHKVRKLEQDKQAAEKLAQSIPQFGRKVFPLWSQHIQDCIDLSTREINQICHYFTNTIEHLRSGGKLSHGQLMDGEYDLIANQVIENAQHGIESIQFQDRVTQIMSHMNATMTELSFKCESKYPINIDEFLHINSATYTTEDERLAYQQLIGKPAIAAEQLDDQNEVTLF